MPIILIDKIAQSNRSANVTTSGFFYLVDSIDTNFNVTGRQTSASDPAAGSGPSAGERWIVEDVSDVSGYFSAGLGAAEDNDIVEYDGSAWSVIVDVDNAKTDEGQLVYVEDENLFYFYNGTSWGTLGSDNYVDSLAFATGTGTLTVGRTGALADLTVGLDGRYLTSQTSHADVVVDGDFGSEGLMKRGVSTGTYSIVTDASANWNTAYAWGDHGAAGYQAGDTDLTAIAGLTRTRGDLIVGGALAWTDLSIGGANTVLTTNGTDPAWTTVTNAMLAGSIANDKLANSSVSYGGVSLSLGGSDATPAFDLTDATNYPTSSLTGTITNAQLAGGIVDGKISSAAAWNAKTDLDGTTNDTITTVTGANAIQGEANLKFDGTTLKVGELDYAGNVDGLVCTAPPFTINATIDAVDADRLSIEASGRITTEGGLRCLGNTYQLGPKGGGTTNFLSNEGVKTELDGAVASGATVITVGTGGGDTHPTQGMAVGDTVLFSARDSNSSSATDQVSRTISAVSTDPLTQFTISAPLWTGGGSAPSYSLDAAWVDVLGTGNLNFRNSNVKTSGSAGLQFDYSATSLGYNGGRLKFRSYKRRTPSGESTTTTRLEIDRDGKVTFNPEGDPNGDFCVEGDTDNALLYVDASTDRVGISTSAPSHGFHCDTGMGYPVVTTTGDHAILDDERIIYADASSGDSEITLPAAVIGRVIEVYRKDVGPGYPSGTVLTLARKSGTSDTINGRTSIGSAPDGTISYWARYTGYRCICVETGVWIAHSQARGFYG
jgi:hypothetical protein